MRYAAANALSQWIRTRDRGRPTQVNLQPPGPARTHRPISSTHRVDRQRRLHWTVVRPMSCSPPLRARRQGLVLGVATAAASSPTTTAANTVTGAKNASTILSTP